MFSTLFKRAGRNADAARAAARASEQLGERDRRIGQLEDQLRAQQRRFALVRQASGEAWWEMQVDSADASGATRSFAWSDQMRQLLGFRDERDFPDAAASWSSRLHPEDGGARWRPSMRTWPTIARARAMTFNTA